jgi:hypothetical protein
MSKLISHYTCLFFIYLFILQERDIRPLATFLLGLMGNPALPRRVKGGCSKKKVSKCKNTIKILAVFERI